MGAEGECGPHVCVLTCREDSDEPAIVTQKIDYTDFPLGAHQAVRRGRTVVAAGGALDMKTEPTKSADAFTLARESTDSGRRTPRVVETGKIEAAACCSRERIVWRGRKTFGTLMGRRVRREMPTCCGRKAANGSTSASPADGGSVAAVPFAARRPRLPGRRRLPREGPWTFACGTSNLTTSLAENRRLKQPSTRLLRLARPFLPEVPKDGVGLLGSPENPRNHLDRAAFRGGPLAMPVHGPQPRRRGRNFLALFAGHIRS